MQDRSPDPFTAADVRTATEDLLDELNKHRHAEQPVPEPAARQQPEPAARVQINSIGNVISGNSVVVIPSQTFTVNK